MVSGPGTAPLQKNSISSKPSGPYRAMNLLKFKIFWELVELV
jgi:hypothetical protein